MLAVYNRILNKNKPVRLIIISIFWFNNLVGTSIIISIIIA